MADLASHLSDDEARRLAYESALTIINADGSANASEQAFLEELRAALGFSDTLNLDPDFHTLALGGIYVEAGRGELVFRHVPPPSDAEVARVADRVHRSVARRMEKRGLGPQADPDEER